MPDRLREIGALGQAYSLGHRSYRRLFRTTLAGPDQPFRVDQRIEEDANGPTERDLEHAAFCEVQWLRSQAVKATKERAKEVKPLIRAAIEEGDRPTALRYRKEMAKARAAVRDDLRKKGGVAAGLNSPNARERGATRDLFILCLGFTEETQRQAEKAALRAQNATLSGGGASTSNHVS